MNIFNPIYLTVSNPEHNACDGSTRLTADNINNTFAILNEHGECIECEYKGIKCLPEVDSYANGSARLKIIPDVIFYIKLKYTEL